MSLKAIYGDIQASIKNWYRNKAALFWTFAFPILLILIFGEIFSGGNEPYIIYIQDMDNSTASHFFVENMSHINIIKVKLIDSNKNIKEYAKEHAAIQIPKGFQDSIIYGKKCNLTLYLDPSKQETNSAIKSFLISIIGEMNLKINNATEIIGYKEEYVTGNNFNYIDFFIPGIIGMTVMTSAIYGSIEINVKYKKRGLLKKLLTTPMKRGEWIFSKMIYQLIINFLSAIAIILVGIFAFNVKASFNFMVIVIITSASFAFTGIGMIISRFVNEEETADSAASAVNFPMMFLAGSFFPIEIMPHFLQVFAKILPLYYVNEGLRNAMIYHNFHASMLNAIIITVFAFIVFAIGILITNWKES